MSDARSFPPGFLWGTSSSSHQNEGHNTNNQWWPFEQEPDAIWRGDRSGAACDWWHQAEADFDRMQALGLNAHRLSIEWSRVEPEPGQFDTAALDRYRAMVDGLRTRGIRPVIALHHFTQPRWFYKQGGWRRSESVHRFQRFTREVTLALRDLCDFWITINEPLVFVAQTYFRGIWPPRRRDPLAALRAFYHQLLAHGAAYQTIHALQPEANVGYAKAVRLFRGLRPGHLADRYAAGIKRYLFEHLWFMAVRDGRLRPPLGMNHYHPLLADSCDFIGINYYTRDLVRFSPNPLALFGSEQFDPNGEFSDCTRDHRPYSEYAPQGLYQICRELQDFGKPLYITENGLPDAQDQQRPRWLVGHLAHLHRAIEDGCDVRGYFHWTFVDNFEWSEGWGLRFGLFEMDPTTQERRPRCSAQLYAEMAQRNALPHALLRRYTPELLP